MTPAKQLMLGIQVDRLLRYPRGRSVKLARKGKIPYILLPDGEVRFDADQVEQFLAASTRRPGQREVPGAN